MGADADAAGRGGDVRAGRFELALVLLGHALLYVVLNGNFDHDYDAQQYGRIALEIARGEYQLATHPFSQRFGVTAPAAVLFRLSGVSWLTATLWPLVCSLATIALVHGAAARAAGRRAALAAALLLATNLVQVRYSSRLLPDVVVSAFMLAGAVAISKTTPLVNVSRGQLVPYVITVNNNAGLLLADLTILDRIPLGFTYVQGSGRVDGVPAEPTVAGRDLSWTGLALASTEGRTVRLLLVVGGAGMLYLHHRNTDFPTDAPIAACAGS